MWFCFSFTRHSTGLSRMSTHNNYLTFLTLCLDWHHGCSSSPTAVRFSSGRFFPVKALCFGKEEDRRCIWTVIKLCKGIFWVCCRWGVLVMFELKQCIHVRSYMLFVCFVCIGQKPVGTLHWRTSPSRTRIWRFRHMLTNYLSLRRCWHADIWKWPSLAGRIILAFTLITVLMQRNCNNLNRSNKRVC